MVAGPVQIAKRALVSLLLALAQEYGVCLTLKREDSDALINAAYRKVVKRVHPDKGSDTVSSFKVAKFILALKNLGIWQVLCFQQFPAVSVHPGIWQVLCFQQFQFL